MRYKASGLLAGVTAAAVALLLSGCGNDAAATPSTSTSTTTITSSSDSAPASTDTSASSAPATPTVASPTNSAPAGTVTSTATSTATSTVTTTEPPPPSSSDTETVDANHCLSKNLSVTLGNGDGAAGSSYYDLVFTNTGSAACTLDGHPGVSFVGGDDGHQIGLSADMDNSVPNTLVTIQPGTSAKATLRVTQAGNYDAAQCSPETARGLRIYPPDETASVYVEQQLDACASDAQNLLTISSVA